MAYKKVVEKQSGRKPTGKKYKLVFMEKSTWEKLEKAYLKETGLSKVDIKNFKDFREEVILRGLKTYGI